MRVRALAVVFGLLFLGVVSGRAAPAESPASSSGERTLQARRLLSAAVDHMSAGRTNAALAAATRLRAFGPPWDGRGAFLQSRLLRNSRNFASALSAIDGALPSLSSVGDYVLWDRAELLLSLHRDGEAIKSLVRLRALYPDSPLARDASMREAELRVLGGDYGAALRVLKPLVSRHDVPAESLAAEVCARLNDTACARSYWEEIYIHHPASPLAGKAERRLNAMGGPPAGRDLLLLRAEGLVKARMIDDAERVYRKLLKREPDNPRLWELLGQALFRGRRYPEAVDALDRSDGAEAALLRLRALYRSQVPMEETVREIERVLARFPSLDGRLYNMRIQLARDLRRMGEYDRAIAQFEWIKRRYPSRRAATRWELAWTWYRAGKPARAEKILRENVSSDGNRYRPGYWRARFLDLVGNRARSRHIFEEIVQARDSGYYGFLSEEHLARPYGLPAGRPGGAPSSHPDVFQLLSRIEGIERVRELRLLGFYPEARRELPALSRRVETRDDRVAFARLCIDLGDYRRAIGVGEGLWKTRGDVLDLSFPRGYWNDVQRASQRKGVDPYLVAAVIREESRFQYDAVSPAGAVGLMQLMEQTALRMYGEAGVSRPTPEGLKQPRVNISIGVAYLGQLLQRYDGDFLKSLAAYNAGERAVDRWLNELGTVSADTFAEEIPYRETRRYVRKVLASYRMYRRVWGLTPPALFDIVRADDPG